MILCVCPNPSVDTYWWLNDLKTGGVNRIQKEAYFPGGKGTHVAMAIAELGETASLLGFWAGDSGKWIMAKCAEKNINCHGVQLSEGRNRKCITVRSGNTEINHTEFLCEGPLITEENYDELLQQYYSLLNQCEVVVLSGSWPKGAPEDAYGEMIDLANEQQKKVWVDCSRKLLQSALLHKPYGVHINKSEAEGIINTGEKLESYFLEYVHQLALTAGADGLYLYDKDGCIHAVSSIKNVYSTVGSGDCLTAGLAVSNVRNYTKENAAKIGAACGAANCIREELGMLYKTDVDELLKITTVFNNNYYHSKPHIHELK